jgi:hypothetical protein
VWPRSLLNCEIEIAGVWGYTIRGNSGTHVSKRDVGADSRRGLHLLREQRQDWLGRVVGRLARSFPAPGAVETDLTVR